jgi:hypothetical protein
MEDIMATESFYKDLILETEEEIQSLWDAFEEADSGAPGMDLSKAHKPVTDPEELERLTRLD